MELKNPKLATGINFSGRFAESRRTSWERSSDIVASKLMDKMDIGRERTINEWIRTMVLTIASKINQSGRD